MVLRRIDPMSLAKVYAVIVAVMMFIVALPAGCVMTMVGSFSGEYGGGAFGTGMGLFVLILYPLFGLILGFISGFLMAWIYNLVAERIGGVELEFDEEYFDEPPL